MVLECYFDGANKPTPEHDRVVLATACGKSEQWQGFASAWNDLLKHFPAPPLHTKEAAIHIPPGEEDTVRGRRLCSNQRGKCEDGTL
jgi:hypothetical protein